MVPLFSGLCGSFLAAYLAFKHEWPGVTILAFAALGFVVLYGAGMLVTARAVAHL